MLRKHPLFPTMFRGFRQPGRGNHLAPLKSFGAPAPLRGLAFLPLHPFPQPGPLVASGLPWDILAWAVHREAGQWSQGRPLVSTLALSCLLQAPELGCSVTWGYVWGAVWEMFSGVEKAASRPKQLF